MKRKPTRKRLEKIFGSKIQKLSMTPRQRKLSRKHGTPAEFAISVYKCVPGDISMDQARAAVDKYCREWNERE